MKPEANFSKRRKIKVGTQVVSFSAVLKYKKSVTQKRLELLASFVAKTTKLQLEIERTFRGVSAFLSAQHEEDDEDDGGRKKRPMYLLLRLWNQSRTLLGYFGIVMYPKMKQRKAIIGAINFVGENDCFVCIS